MSKFRSSIKYIWKLSILIGRNLKPSIYKWINEFWRKWTTFKYKRAIRNTVVVWISNIFEIMTTYETYDFRLPKGMVFIPFSIPFIAKK